MKETCIPPSDVMHTSSWYRFIEGGTVTLCQVGGGDNRDDKEAQSASINKTAECNTFTPRVHLELPQHPQRSRVLCKHMFRTVAHLKDDSVDCHHTVNRHHPASEDVTHQRFADTVYHEDEVLRRLSLERYVSVRG